MSRRKPSKETKSQKQDSIPVHGPLNSKGWKNNPNYYFKDATQAEVMSRIQMNAFGAVTPLVDRAPDWYNKFLPAIMAVYFNPCPGVNVIRADNALETPDPNISSALGINRAAQKLWYILTAKSGRAAGYTRSELSKMICAFGEIISTYEFIRRVFGISYAYSQRNRALPTMLWQAMNVDPDDFRENSANYLKRMNSLMAVMNQLPVMGNIAYFSKCQDMYQNIFMDAPSEMAQLWVMCPSTTWVLEEDDGFIGGSYLKTVDMCVQHDDVTADICGGSTATRNCAISSLGYKKLSAYIDTFELQINKLLISASFSTVYADILRAFDTGTLTRWSFDYIDEKYLVTPIYNDGFLWQMHNATIPRGINTVTKTDFDSSFDANDYQKSFKNGTPRNDVYEWASSDILVYNPVLNSAQINDNGLGRGFGKMLIDFPSDTPSVEERIEYTRYTIAPYTSDVTRAVFPGVIIDNSETDSVIAFNYNLPDHWIEVSRILFTEGDTYEYTAFDSRFDAPNIQSTNYGVPVDVSTVTKFHLFPLIVTATAGSFSDTILDAYAGEVNAWAAVDASWFADINQMIYVDLYDIR